MKRINFDEVKIGEVFFTDNYYNSAAVKIDDSHFKYLEEDSIVENCGECVYVFDGYRLSAPAQYLKFDDGTFFGKMGEKTNYYDINGYQLCIGDVVTKTSLETGVVYGPSFVVHDKENYDDSFVMGIACFCYHDIGAIDRRWKVERIKSWEDVEDGEIYNRVCCCGR